MNLDLAPSTPMPMIFAAGTPPQWTEFATRRPRAIATRAETVTLRQAHVERARELAIIGRRAYSPDRPRADHWDDEPPFVDGQRTVGFDCENLALWARRMMAVEFEDWPLGCARPTICTLPDGRGHCVLTVVAEDLGDYVIGTQHEEHFIPWRRLVGYQWLSRLEAANAWKMISA